LEASADKPQTGPTGRVDPSLPQVFGRYLLVQRLSRGGMGEIFLAKHGLAGFEKLAVIKKVLPNLSADQQFISRFVDEAQVAIKLQHVNVAQVFEVGRCGTEYFLALEYVEGRDLRRILSILGSHKRRLPVDLALFIGRELSNGLAYAHRRTSVDGSSLRLVHCDISPPNVLVSFEGETKVIDFGIAKSALRGTATDPKMGFGKFGYMAPEQLIRGGIVDHRTDIYAAGVVLYELLTGKRLYEAGQEPDYRALAKMVAKGEHDLPSHTDALLAPYDDLVATALRPKPEDRYQSAAEFRDAIQQCLVNVNPTISTDQLGAFMRELFSDEMVAQRELHERIAKAHLEDFQDQLTTQTVSTVSFALANLPLKAGAEPPPPEPLLPRTRTPTSRPVVRPPTGETEILPTPHGTAQLETSDLSLADGTGTSVRKIVPPSRTPIFIGAAVVICVIAGIAFALTRDGGEQKPAPQNQVATMGKPTYTVDPIIEPAGAGSATGSAAGSANVTDSAIQLDPLPPPTTEPGSGVKTVDRNAGRHHHPKDMRHVDPKGSGDAKTQPDAGPTRDAIVAKYRAVRHEYEAYAAQNGARLETEWNDLVQFYQFHPTELAEFSRRLDGFRAKLRE
jgi:serine/threonine protein kinase